MAKKRYYPSQQDGQQPKPRAALPVQVPTTKEEATFNLLLQRLDQIATEQRLQAQLLSSLRTEQDAERVTLKQEMLAFKRETESALAASVEAIKRLSTAVPVDEKTKQDIYNAAVEDAKKSAEIKRQNMLAYLESQPKGEVVHHFPEDLTFTMNGIRCVLRAGVVNKNVPKAFIDLYQNWVDTNRKGAKFEQGMRGMLNYGDLEALLSQGRAAEWRQYGVTYGEQ